MRTARVLLPLALLLAVVRPAPADPACPAPRCADQLVPLPAGVVVPDSHVRVLVPADYATSGKTYPVLYLLHGAGDTYKTWTTNTNVLAQTGGLDLIVVMPDSGRNAEAGWYSDWVDGSRQWETFHTSTLVEWVESNYRTNGRRAIAGLSMGGFGAMHDAARHPREYAVAASFSGAVDIRYAEPATGVVFSLAHNNYGTPDDRIWGNQVTDEANWRANNPTDLAASLRGTTLLIASGNGLPGGPHEDPSNPGGYALENGVWQMNLSFERALDAAGIPYTSNLYGAGQHSWPYWQDSLAWALPRIMDALA